MACRDCFSDQLNRKPKTMNYHLTFKSSNPKTGEMPVSTSSKTTCWEGCAFYGTSCYALGKLNFHWDAVTRWERGGRFPDFLAEVRKIATGSIWRYAQAGDLPGEGARIDRRELWELVKANKGKRGYAYTHKPMLETEHAKSNREAVRVANRHGFTINLSANNLEHADRLADLGIAPVCVVVPEDSPVAFETPGGRRGIVCPAQTRDNLTCKDCQLCARPTRSVLIGFRAHGIRKKHASRVACGE